MEQALNSSHKNSYPKEPFKSIEQTREWMSSKVFLEGPADIIGRSFNFAILDKSIPETEEQLIGYVSVNTLDPCPEIGYSLLPTSWGKGYATEAVGMMLKKWWALPRRNMDEFNETEEKIYAICEKGNIGSSTVLHKCGFQVVSDFCFGSDELFVWALKKP
jgi:RimJ/RimL family protein N-acetyltransferase